MSTCHNGSWVGVDLDGTLAHYEGWYGVAHIGEPIPEMVARVKQWLAEGTKVKIMTARVWGLKEGRPDAHAAVLHIQRWCDKHIGVVLEVTCEKDLKMFELWDDRCVCVERNTGRILGRNP